MGKICSQVEYAEKREVLVANAKKERSRLVWVSFGIFIVVLPFMDG